MQRLDPGRAKHVGRFAGKAQEGVSSFAFDAGPHGAPLFGAIGAGTGDVGEGRGRVEADKSVGCGQIHVIDHLGITFLGHA